MSEPIQPTPETEERKKLFARRALIQAGWVIPAVGIMAFPSESGAATGHADGGHNDLFNNPHTDLGPPHSDAAHGDLHFDNGAPHIDIVPHSDRNVPHNDVIHSDAGGGTPPHSDSGL